MTEAMWQSDRSKKVTVGQGFAREEVSAYVSLIQICKVEVVPNMNPQAL